jgi:hypothetical protein
VALDDDTALQRAERALLDDLLRARGRDDSHMVLAGALHRQVTLPALFTRPRSAPGRGADLARQHSRPADQQMHVVW